MTELPARLPARELPGAEEILTVVREMWDGDDPPRSFSTGVAGPLRSHPGYDHPGPVTVNPYWETVGWLPAQSPLLFGPPSLLPDVSMLAIRPTTGPVLHASRDVLVWTYAWSIPSPGDLAFITRHLAGRGVVEMGAGSGYWAWQLAQAGVDVLAYDAQPGGNDHVGPVQYHPVHLGGPDTVAEHGDRALLLCWPPGEDSMAADTLAAYPGDMLIYLGEFNPHCNASPAFFDALERDWEPAGISFCHVNFSGLHCRLMVFTRHTQNEGAPMTHANDAPADYEFPTFKTVDEMIAAAPDSGFDEETNRKFGTRIYPEVYGGRVFVTSEMPRGHNGWKRFYTVRMAVRYTDTGNVAITTIGTACGYAHLSSARRAAMTYGEKTDRAELVKLVDPTAQNPPHHQ